ncbi:MAG: general stress protein [Chloroflexi bacterium]|nr:general stress protein [Chloroflexota bacterium]
MKTVAGIFSTQMQAQRAVEELRLAGFHPERVSVITRSPEQARAIAGETGTEVAAATAGGAGLGAILGAAAGWMVGIGALTIPGIGPVVAAGPIATALGVAGTTAAAGAGIGVVAGGVVGALTGWGFSEAEAREYESRVTRGDILLAVEVPDGEDTGQAEGVLRAAGGDRVSSSALWS